MTPSRIATYEAVQYRARAYASGHDAIYWERKALRCRAARLALRTVNVNRSRADRDAYTRWQFGAPEDTREDRRVNLARWHFLAGETLASLETLEGMAKGGYYYPADQTSR